MTLTQLAARNLLRNKFRAALTIAGVAVAILTFMLLRTVISAWTAGADFAAKDRVVTRHKITFVMTLPKRYADQIKEIPGVKVAAYNNWFGGKDPKHDREFFATIAVESATFFQVYDEALLSAGDKERWMQDRRGAIVGDVLATKMGWKVGDKVTLQSGIYRGDWDFTVDGIYTATRKSIDRSQFIFHWDYLNETAPARMKDQIGWIVSRVTDPSRAAEIGTTIDKVFDEKDTQTLSQDERAFQASFLAMMSAVLKAIDIVSLAIMLIMMLILGNTIAMGVRERVGEYGTLRALGFLPHHIAGFVLGESVLIGLLGGVLGVALSYPIVEKGLGRWIEENMGSFLPYFRISASTAGVAVLLAVGLGLVAAAIPARQAAKLNVIDALRKVG